LVPDEKQRKGFFNQQSAISKRQSSIIIHHSTTQKCLNSPALSITLYAATAKRPIRMNVAGCFSGDLKTMVRE